MPDLIVVVSGTGTGVGKTWVASRVVHALRESGTSVAARKPVQSFDAGDEMTDARILAAASGEDEFVVCPSHRRYPLAMAPPIAADALGRDRLLLAEVMRELELPRSGTALIEGVGGPRSPLCHDADTVALANTLRADVTVLVADAGLGAINAVLVNAACFDESPVVVMLNRFDPEDDVHVRNLHWLRRVATFPMFTCISDVAADLLSRSSATSPRRVVQTELL